MLAPQTWLIPDVIWGFESVFLAGDPIKRKLGRHLTRRADKAANKSKRKVRIGPNRAIKLTLSNISVFSW